MVTRIPLNENLDLTGSKVFFRLSIALDEEILTAGIMLKNTLRTRIPANEVMINPGEEVRLEL
jgi:hypothetical protein